MNNLSPSDQHVYFLKDGKIIYLFLSGGYRSVYVPGKTGKIVVGKNLWHEETVIFETKDQKELDSKFTELMNFIQKNITNLPVQLPDNFFKTGQ